MVLLYFFNAHNNEKRDAKRTRNICNWLIFARYCAGFYIFSLPRCKRQTLQFAKAPARSAQKQQRANHKQRLQSRSQKEHLNHFCKNQIFFEQPNYFISTMPQHPPPLKKRSPPSRLSAVSKPIVSLQVLVSIVLMVAKQCQPNLSPTSRHHISRVSCNFPPANNQASKDVGNKALAWN